LRERGQIGSPAKGKEALPARGAGSGGTVVATSPVVFSDFI
jgi:hypothetical protein